MSADEAEEDGVRQRARENREHEHPDRHLNADRLHRRARRRPERAPEHLLPRQVRNRLAPCPQEVPADRDRDGADGRQRERVHGERPEEDVDLVQPEGEREQERDDPVEADQRREGDRDADREGGRDDLGRRIAPEHVEKAILERAVSRRQSGRTRRRAGAPAARRARASRPRRRRSSRCASARSARRGSPPRRASSSGP